MTELKPVGLAAMKALADEWLKSDNPVVRGDGEDLMREYKAIRAEMSAPGDKFRLPPLLEAKRQLYGITDGAFKKRALFERCYIFQVAEMTKTAGSEGIIRVTESAEQREYEQTSIGVLVTAGLNALDHLYANGIELGHLVEFCRNAPLRTRYDIINGKHRHLIVCMAGDITASFDLEENLRARRCHIKYDEANAQHRFMDAEGKLWTPTSPGMPTDY